MGFHYSPNEPHQVHAIESVVNVLEGTPRNSIPLFQADNLAGAIPNVIDLDDGALLSNLTAVQTKSDIPPDKELLKLEERIQDGVEERDVAFPNLSVEMETGTGKTYVYLRTILELYKRYALRKFIVVVPSIAIREGVLKTIDSTTEHFRELYGAIPARTSLYNSGSPELVRQFAASDGVEIMVMTIDSFTRASNVMFQPNDRLGGHAPVEFIRASRPILILDEPQTMASDNRIQALATLDPVLALRYSATHLNPYNLVSRLTPYEAYRQGLVKFITVAGVTQEHDVARPFIRVDEVRASGNSLSARLTVQMLMANGTVKEKQVIVKPGTDLEEATKREEYSGLVVDEISKRGNYVAFHPGGFQLRAGEAVGADREAIWDAQIRFTIEQHFKKARALKDRGIKVLSLFFLDRVANWSDDDGVVKALFIAAFDDLKKDYPEWKDEFALEVAGSYFAQQKRRTGEVDLIDSKSTDNDADAAAYNAIMRDKEKLLKFGESPISFIFSHSALGLGWDNPNVFQICTLRQSASTTKKRQEIGRGMRLCVGQDLHRVTDPDVNILTVVANESYESFVTALQTEIEDDYGKDSAPPRPADARKPASLTLDPAALADPDFVELWNRIAAQTTYEVNIDTKALIAAVAADLADVKVNTPRVVITRAEVDLSDTNDAFIAMKSSGSRAVEDLVGRYPLPNLVDLISSLLENTSPQVHLTRSTVLGILRALKDLEPALTNPAEFAAEVARSIKRCLTEQLVGGITYTRSGAAYDLSSFAADVATWEQYVAKATKGPYDGVIVDSNVEREFVQGLNTTDPVRTFTKLPAWFKIPTPLGTYNPDWAIVWQETDEFGNKSDPKIYMVRETKSTVVKGALRTSEERKIACAEVHFDALGDVDYEVVTSIDDLPRRVS